LPLILKKRSNSLKSLFYSSGETWWLIGFSMILAGGMLTEPQILTSFIINGDLSGMWLIWSGIIGVSFGRVFFAHLWYRLPVNTENEFILFRFSGTGARWLHIFRSLYVGGIVAPLMLSMIFIAFGRVLSEIAGVSFPIAIGIILGYILVGTFFNSLRERLRFDFIYFIIFILCLVFIILSLLKNLGSISDLTIAINSSAIEFKLIPQQKTEGLNTFLIFVLVQWWSASIIDMPSLTGQKFMAAQSQQSIVKSIILPQILFAIFLITISIIPFYVLLLDKSNQLSSNGEIAFLNIFTQTFSGNSKWVVLLFYFLPFTAISQNNQNWCGSLLVQNFYNYYINPRATEKQLIKTGILVMIFVVLVAALISLLNNSILSIVKYIFTITAGVGPVFILRWYWHRINAWTQLTAMVVSLIFPTLYDLAYANIPAFTQMLDSAMSSLSIEYFPLKIVLLTIMVCATWITVMYSTKPTEKETIEKFVRALRPGGVWRIKDSGNVMFPKRIVTALLLTLANLLNFVVIWKIVTGFYLLGAFLFVISVIVLLLAYYLLKRLNLQNG
jgi:solute:Na+ symporter, SSS family